MYYIWTFCAVNRRWVRGSGDDCKMGIMYAYWALLADYPWQASVVLPEGQKPFEV